MKKIKDCASGFMEKIKNHPEFQYSAGAVISGAYGYCFGKYTYPSMSSYLEPVASEMYSDPALLNVLPIPDWLYSIDASVFHQHAPEIFLAVGLAAGIIIAGESILARKQENRQEKIKFNDYDDLTSRSYHERNKERKWKYY